MNNFGADGKYLFARIYPELGLGKEKMEEHSADIDGFAEVQVKRFGGNSASKVDFNRGLKRALKLINLGFEKASKKTVLGPDGEIFDLAKAKRVLAVIPFPTLYNLGLNYFEGNANGALRKLKECERKIGRLWFRMIGEEEMDLLKKVSNLDTCYGTEAEYAQALRVCLEIEDKIHLIPCLPLHEDHMFSVNRHGAVSKGVYPSKNGLIDVILVSLLIACLFREKDRNGDICTTEMSDLYKFNVAICEREVRAGEKGGEEKLLSTIIEHRKAYEEWRARIFDEQDKIAQILLMLDTLSVSVEEIKSFTKMLIEEPEEFRKRMEKTVEGFKRYFLVMSNIMRLKSPVDYALKAWKILPGIADRLVRSVQDFYVDSDIDSVNSAETVKFWIDRVIIRDIRNDEDLLALSEEGEEVLDIDILVRSHPARMLNATGRFMYWSQERKKDFITKFNPNRLVDAKGNSGFLLNFLKNISPGDEGWSDISKFSTKDDGIGLIKSHMKPSKGEAAMVVYQEEECWVAQAMKKIAWRHLPPDYIGNLWTFGSDRVRDFVFSRREEFKASLPALKNYYISENPDTRLAEYMITRLFHQDKIRTDGVWESIIWQAGNNPGLVEKIKKLREKLAK